MTTADLCLDSFEVYDPPEAVSIDIEVKVPNEHGGNYIKRKRYKTPREIYRQLHEQLNLNVCQCGHEWKYETQSWDDPCPECGADLDSRIMLIDEYDSSCHFGDDEDKEIAPRDWWTLETMVYSAVGGNEGYGVHVSLLLQDPKSRKTKTVHVYRIKSFLGMRHCHNLVERIQKLLGVWPDWCKD